MQDTLPTVPSSLACFCNYPKYIQQSKYPNCSLVVPLRETYLEGTINDEQIKAYIMGCAYHDEIGGWKQRRKSGKKLVRILLGTFKKSI
jgi:hypothetical protein